MKITPKQERFVEQYLIDLNATQAAIRAGYSRKTAKQQASRLLTNVDLAHAIQEARKQQTESAGLSAARVLEELRRIAFTDARRFFDDSGNLLPFSGLDEERGSQLAGFDVIIANAKAGDGHTDTIHRIKFWDKTRALEMLCKYFGLLQERIDHTASVTIRWETEVNEKLVAARQRLAKETTEVKYAITQGEIPSGY